MKETLNPWEKGGTQPPQTAPPVNAVNPSSTDLHQEASRVVKKFSLPKIHIPKKLFLIAGLVVVVVIFATLLLKLRQQSATSGQRGEVVWWGTQIDSSIILPLIEEYESQNPNVNITYAKQSTQDYRERLVAALATENAPDIFEIHNSWTSSFSANLSPFPQSVFSLEEFKNTYYPVIVGDLTAEKGVLAVPLEYDAITLFINQDIFAAALKEPPKTWDDLTTIAQELTQKDKQTGVILQSGVALGIIENVDHWPEVLALMMYQNGVNPAVPTGKAFDDVVAFYKRFKTNGVWDDKLPVSTTAFARGRLAMYFAPTRRVPDILKINPNLRFISVALPQLPKNTPGQVDVSYATYWAQGVREGSSDKNEAFKFLKFLTSRESTEKLNANHKKANLLGRPIPRLDMAVLQSDHSVLGSVITQAPNAKSWYLADRTFDGDRGINTQLESLFGNVVTDTKSEGFDIKTFPQKVTDVLSSFGASVRGIRFPF